MSWLGPASSGAHPRTKGARFCAGGHRHRIPLTTKGLRVARPVRQAIGRPFAVGGRNADQQNARDAVRSVEHTSELPSLMRISYAVFCLKKKKIQLPTLTRKTDN